jgi:predicted nucleic acid-binding Zn ribbon protein
VSPRNDRGSPGNPGSPGGSPRPRPVRRQPPRPQPEPGVRRDPTRTAEEQGIGTVLDELLGRGPWRTGLALGELARRWEQVVGERLAGESEPWSLSDGILVVRASSAGWAAQLTFLGGEIRARANDVLRQPGVSVVRVTVDPGRPSPVRG